MDSDIKSGDTPRQITRDNFYETRRIINTNRTPPRQQSASQTHKPDIQDQEPISLEDTAFPFDREGDLQTVAAGVSAVGVIQKLPLFAAFNGVIVQYAVPVLATILIGGGIGLGVASIVNNIKVQNQVEHYATSASDSGETNNSNSFIPSTDPRYPVKIEIKSLSVVANTVSVGINKEGNIGSPASIKELAWYKDSSSPIDAGGTSIIVGHAGSPTYPGVLSTVSKVKIGSDIKVTMGDGKILLYKVISTEEVPVDEVEMSKYFKQPGQTERLMNFITCSGAYNDKTYSYANRLIVTAKVVENTP